MHRVAPLCAIPNTAPPQMQDSDSGDTIHGSASLTLNLLRRYSGQGQAPSPRGRGDFVSRAAGPQEPNQASMFPEGERNP